MGSLGGGFCRCWDPWGRGVLPHFGVSGGILPHFGVARGASGVPGVSPIVVFPPPTPIPPQIGAPWDGGGGSGAGAGPAGGGAPGGAPPARPGGDLAAAGPRGRGGGHPCPDPGRLAGLLPVRPQPPLPPAGTGQGPGEVWGGARGPPSPLCLPPVHPVRHPPGAAGAVGASPVPAVGPVAAAAARVPPACGRECPPPAPCPLASPCVPPSVLWDPPGSPGHPKAEPCGQGLPTCPSASPQVL